MLFSGTRSVRCCDVASSWFVVSTCVRLVAGNYLCCYVLHPRILRLVSGSDIGMGRCREGLMKEHNSGALLRAAKVVAVLG